ncbi:hypothetical protein B2A_07372, partial [mine drainage metagenome]
SLVLGQSSFTGALSGLTATNLSHPLSVFPTATMVWVADYNNNRVLGFPAPFQTGESATVVLGQPNFLTVSATGSASLAGPDGVSLDAQGHVWVSAGGQARVVEFPLEPGTYAAPLTVLGQSTLTGTTSGITATNLTDPTGVLVGNDSAWVGDLGADRVLEFVPTTFTVQVQESGLPAGDT